MEVMVSVIMPTYNHERYIRQALESVFMQKISFSMEILIGDDCSTDGTLAIINEYKAKYPDKIRIFAHSENVGATRNAYELLTHAEGQYLATLEGDDFWTDPCKLQKQIDFLEVSPQYIGCTHYFSIVDEEGKMLKNQKLSWVRQKDIFTLKDFDGILMPGQPSTFVRRNIFRNPEHDYSICYKAHAMIADRTLMLIFLLQGDFFLLPEKLSSYRKHTDKEASNVTSKEYVSKRSLSSDYDMLELMEQYAKNNFEKRISFSHTKQTIFSRALIKSLICPNNDTIKDFNRILYRMKHPLLAFLRVPFTGVSLIKQHYLWRK